MTRGCMNGFSRSGNADRMGEGAYIVKPRSEGERRGFLGEGGKKRVRQLPSTRLPLTKTGCRFIAAKTSIGA